MTVFVNVIPRIGSVCVVFAVTLPSSIMILLNAEGQQFYNRSRARALISRNSRTYSAIMYSDTWFECCGLLLWHRAPTYSMWTNMRHTLHRTFASYSGRARCELWPNGERTAPRVVAIYTQSIYGTSCYMRKCMSRAVAVRTYMWTPSAYCCDGRAPHLILKAYHHKTRFTVGDPQAASRARIVSSWMCNWFSIIFKCKCNANARAPYPAFVLLLDRIIACARSYVCISWCVYNWQSNSLNNAL